MATRHFHYGGQAVIEGVMIRGEATKDGFKELSRSELGEATGASPAFATGRIYLRGKKHLFCIGTKDGK